LFKAGQRECQRQLFVRFARGSKSTRQFLSNPIGLLHLDQLFNIHRDSGPKCLLERIEGYGDLLLLVAKILLSEHTPNEHFDKAADVGPGPLSH
jgi:hypothetical protein